MNNDKTLDVLTGQPVTVTLGGRTYRARRATLYDLGVMNRKRDEFIKAENTANLDMDVLLFMLYTLVKDVTPDFPFENPDEFAKSIPFDSLETVVKALEIVGFKQPQTPKK